MPTTSSQMPSAVVARLTLGENFEALPTDMNLLAMSAAATGVELYNKLFLLERAFEGLDDKGHRVRKPLNAEPRCTVRQEQSKLVMDDFYAWLGEIRPVGGIKLASTIQYCLTKRFIYVVFREWKHSRGQRLRRECPPSLGG